MPDVPLFPSAFIHFCDNAVAFRLVSSSGAPPTPSTLPESSAYLSEWSHPPLSPWYLRAPGADPQIRTAILCRPIPAYLIPRLVGLKTQTPIRARGQNQIFERRRIPVHANNLVCKTKERSGCHVYETSEYPDYSQIKRVACAPTTRHDIPVRTSGIQFVGSCGTCVGNLRQILQCRFSGDADEPWSDVCMY